MNVRTVRVRCRAFLAAALLAAALLAAAAVPAAAQEQSGADTGSGVRTAPVVSGIAIMGNRTTASEIILREMTLCVGDTVSTEDVEYCQARIYSLGLFNRVSIRYPPMDSTVLLVEVDERWYFYPVPLVGIVDRDLGKWYYGLGVTHQNLRGRNEKLFAGFVLGYNPWASISYSNPWVFGEQHLFTETSLSYSDVVNKSRVSQGEGPNFHEIHYGAGQTLGKRFDPFHSAWVSAAFNYVEVSDKRAGRTADPDGIDRTITLAAGAQHDTRNLREYPTQGLYGGVSLTRRGIGIEAVDHTRAVVDLRWYRVLFTGGPTLALRGLGSVAWGPVLPNYHRVYFGFSERIRGWFFDEFEGENLAALWGELRIPIVPLWYVHVPQVPVPQFATWRFGLYGALFFDAGTTWDRHGRPDLASGPRGYGAGLHLLLPYSFVFRVDRAWNQHGRGEWIFDLGASF